MFELRVTTHLNFAETKQRVKDSVVSRLMKCGYLVEAEAKRLLSHGRTEKRARLNIETGATEHVRERTASAPGEPPHIDTGNLRSSIQTARTLDGHVIVGPVFTAWYGRVHEFGGRFHPARPFMRPALRNTAEKFPEQFGRLDLSGGEKV